MADVGLSYPGGSIVDIAAQIQGMMLGRVKNWIDSTGRDKQEILRRLTSDSVKNHKNKRIGDTSTETGHVHNTMLPDGGLQQVLAQHNIHVVSLVQHEGCKVSDSKPGAQVLNAGQDLLGGKKVSPSWCTHRASLIPQPWDQGFGSGGQHAWRDVNSSAPNDQPPSIAPYSQGQQSSYEAPVPSYSQYGSQPSGDGFPGQHYRQEHQQPSYAGYGGQVQHGGRDDYGGQGGYQTQGSYGGQGTYDQGPPGSYSSGGGYGGPPQGQYSQGGQGGFQGGYNQQGYNQGFQGGPRQDQWGQPQQGQGQWGGGQGQGQGGYRQW